MARELLADVFGEVAALVAATEPEVVSVLVDVRGYPGVKPEVVAPLIARKLYDRPFGAAVHVEAGEERGLFYVAVEALSPARKG
jgi:hypothetical protein